MEVVLLFSMSVISLFFDLMFSLTLFSAFFVSLLMGWGGFWFGGMFFLDSISFFLIFLTVLIFLFCLFSSLMDNWASNFFSSFYFYLLSIFLFLVISFSCFSAILFYMAFEFTFILMFFFLLSWGYSPERLMASFYMIFYTLVVSFPFLVYLIIFSQFNGKFYMLGEMYSYWWVAVIFVFLVKLPIYGVHLWLPKAHVEAPVSGSMVLAGVLLKLGTYGFLRFSPFLLSPLSYSKGILLSIGLSGGLYSCFLCLRQSDLKSFVAYSSVCHMGFGLAGLYSGIYLGYSGSVFMMISHGFCSSCLFYILYVIYERFFTRSGLLVKGIGYLFPMMLLIWFIFSVLNMGVPPSLSFFSEVLILTSISSLTLHTALLSSLLLLFSGFYGIFFYVIACHSSSMLNGSNLAINMREYLIFFGHLFFILSMILFMEFFFL